MASEGWKHGQAAFAEMPEDQLVAYIAMKGGHHEGASAELAKRTYLFTEATGRQYGYAAENAEHARSENRRLKAITDTMLEGHGG